jgi:hypothetical protein
MLVGVLNGSASVGKSTRAPLPPQGGKHSFIHVTPVAEAHTTNACPFNMHNNKLLMFVNHQLQPASLTHCIAPSTWLA